MYLRHFGLKYPPFTRKPNPDVFFVQAGRKNILKDLRDDLRQGNAAMLLTGPKASGKTLFCRLIRHRLDGTSCNVVYLENPVGSFDELLRRICLQLGMPLSADIEQDMAVVLQTLLRGRKEKGKRVLLLIDEAEKMFLAALERLFRLLNELNEQYGMQTMLVGQPALNISLEQLSGYCEDVRIASSYKLEAFSPEETGAYLAYRLRAAGGGRGIKDSAFSGEAVREIFRLGKGVPGVTDAIAEAALENAAAAGAGSVLPVHVAVPDDPDASPVQLDDEESGGRRTGLLFLLILCLLAFFFFGRTSFFSDQEDALQEEIQEPVDAVPENTEISITLPEDEDAPLPFVAEDDGADNPVEKSSNLPKDAEELSLFSLPVPQRPDFKKKEKAAAAPETPEGKNDTNKTAASLDDQAVPSEVSIPVSAVKDDKPRQEKMSEEEGVERNKVVEHVEQQSEKIDKKVVAEVFAEAAEEKPVETRPALSPEELQQAAQAASSDEPGSETLATAKKLPVIKPTWIIELAPGMKKTRPPAPEEHAVEKPAPESGQERKEATTAPPKPKTLVSVASARGVAASTVAGRQQAPSSVVAPPVQRTEVIPVPKIEVRPVTPLSRSAKADQLFARYLGAGNRWTKETYGDKFTVQLVVLSSDDAADSIQDMIVREEYQEHRRKFYILRRDTLPPTLFVCYGVYSSMDEARNARNAMPLFLRKHHPYALSISDVLAKARD